MGAPKVSSAILTMSMARTTPAQNPRGLSSNTRFTLGEVASEPPFERFSSTEEVTQSVYQPATLFQQLSCTQCPPPDNPSASCDFVGSFHYTIATWTHCASRRSWEDFAMAKPDQIPNQISVGKLKKNERPEADRIFRVAFGTFLGMPDPSTFMGDRDLVGSRVRGKHVR